jgi:hypothetical protein
MDFVVCIPRLAQNPLCVKVCTALGRVSVCIRLIAEFSITTTAPKEVDRIDARDESPSSRSRDVTR